MRDPLRRHRSAAGQAAVEPDRSTATDDGDEDDLRRHDNEQDQRGDQGSDGASPGLGRDPDRVGGRSPTTITPTPTKSETRSGVGTAMVVDPCVPAMKMAAIDALPIARPTHNTGGPSFSRSAVDRPSASMARAEEVNMTAAARQAPARPARTRSNPPTYRSG
jgi:hypothetical protein